MDAEPDYSLPGRRVILANLGSFISGGTLARLFSAIALFIIARQVGREAFGQYAPIIATASLTSVLFTLGIDGWILRAGARQPDKLAAYNSASLAIKVVLGSAWLVAALLIQPFLNQESFPASLVLWGCLSILLEQVAMTAWTAFKVSLRNDIATLLLLVFQGSFLLLTVALAFSDVETVITYLQARTAAAALSLILSIVIMLRHYGFRWRAEDTRTALRATPPYGASVTLASIYTRADLFIIAQFLGTDASATYAPASTLINALFLIPQAGFTVLLPLLSRVERANQAVVRKLARRSMLASGAVGIAIGALLWLTAPLLIRIAFGPEFADSSDILRILSLVFVLRCVSVAAAATIVAVGKQNQRVWVQVVVAAVNVSLNLLIINALGPSGVAWVYVLSEAILMLGYYHVLRRHWSQHPAEVAGP